MAHTLAIAQAVSLLNIVFTGMRDLKYTRARNVIMLRLRSIEDLLDLRWVRNSIARKKQALQRLRAKMTIRATVRVLSSWCVLGENSVAARREMVLRKREI